MLSLNQCFSLQLCKRKKKQLNLSLLFLKLGFGSFEFSIFMGGCNLCVTHCGIIVMFDRFSELFSFTIKQEKKRKKSSIDKLKNE